MSNAIFIVWRESVEALLVIGILQVWLNNREQARTGLRFLWGGVAAGVGLALFLAFIMLRVQTELAGTALEYFQIGMMLVASMLIIQMVFWMRRHGRTLKRKLEAGMEQASLRANWWAVAALAALAVGREGAETVIFLYGFGMARTGLAQLQFFAATAAGLGLALCTYWLLSRGGRFFSWRTFFSCSEIVLLFLAAALLVDGVDRMIGLGWLPPLVDPVWDTSALLDDSSVAGSLVASLTGYRAHPALLVLLVYLAYWLLITLFLRHSRPPQRKTA